MSLAGHPLLEETPHLHSALSDLGRVGTSPSSERSSSEEAPHLIGFH